MPTGESPLIYMHMTLYFTDPLWLAAHNVLHAPIILAALGLAGYLGIHSGKRGVATWGAFMLWFALGAGLEIVIVYYAISARSLEKAAKDVHRALVGKNLAEARREVAKFHN